MKGIALAVGVLLLGTGCMSSTRELPADTAKELTPGVVQKEIHNGMAQAQVAEALGSPNIVTKDSDGKETWVYDKIATEVSSSRSEAYGTILILGASKNRAASSVTQRTMTVLIKFDKEGRVESSSFHASKF